MVARSREREHGVKCSNEVAMIECRYWYRRRYKYKYRPTPRSLHSRIVSRHCRCVRCILVIAKGSGIVSRGQERRYSRARSLDGILDADRLMQRENAKLVIDAASSTRSRVFLSFSSLPSLHDLLYSFVVSPKRGFGIRRDSHSRGKER